MQSCSLFGLYISAQELLPPRSGQRFTRIGLGRNRPPGAVPGIFSRTLRITRSCIAHIPAGFRQGYLPALAQ